MNEKDIVAWLEKVDAIIREVVKEQAIIIKKQAVIINEQKNIISRMDEDVAQTEKQNNAMGMYKLEIRELINKLQTKIDGRTMEMVKNISMGISLVLGVMALLKILGVV